MINKLVDRAKMVVASATSTTITLGSASSGYQSFTAAGVPNDTDVRYVIEDGTSWEIGSGTYTASGTTVARQDPPDASSNSGSQLGSLSANAVIYITPAAADLQTLASKVPVRNNTGSAIAAGSLVYSTGSVGGSERIVVEKFTADGSEDELKVVGVVEEELTASGGDGYAVWFGAVKATAFGSFSAGDILYASDTTAGGYVANTPPTAPDQAISVAMVLHPASGLAFVRVRPGFHIGELHDVQLSGSEADGSILVHDGTRFVDESGDTARTSLGLAIGSDVQAYSADLSTYASNPLTAAELQQLQNIDTSTISAAQWGYVGALNQGLTTTSNVTFGTATLGASSTVGGNAVLTTASGVTTGKAIAMAMIFG